MEKETDRVLWAKHIEFFLALLAFAVGLGNVWRFPYLAYKNGGGAFLIPYFISMIILGIPIFYLEMCMGQFSGLDCYKCWNIAPIFRGVGISCILISGIIGTYYNVIVAICMQYIYYSWRKTLPWTLCNESWNVNCSKGEEAEQFFNYAIIGTKSKYFGTYGKLMPNMIGSSFIAWVLVFLSLSFSIKSMGKVSYITALFPYLMITILVIRGATLKGSLQGIQYYLKPDVAKLKDPIVWKQASSQIFFSVAICYGGIVTLSSHNKFRNSALRDSILIPLLNCLTSFYAGFAVFSVMGYLANITGKSVDDVVKSGFGLAFVAYPVGLSTLKAPQFWSTLFFLMMTVLGLGSTFTIAEGFMAALENMLPDHSRVQSVAFRALLCFFYFVLGIPITCENGIHLLNVADDGVGGTFLWIGFLELVGVAYIYGVRNFGKDLEFMLGVKTNILWTICWVFISPVCILAILISGYPKYAYSSDATSVGSKALDVIISNYPLILTFFYAVGYIVYKGFKNAFKSPEWQPSPDNREGYQQLNA